MRTLKRTLTLGVKLLLTFAAIAGVLLCPNNWLAQMQLSETLCDIWES